MALNHSPSIVTNGLVMCLDAANYKSFKGVPATNILNQISYTQGNSNTALYKYTQGSATAYIPAIGYVNSKFVDIYNDYNGGSGNCCPQVFGYGTALPVSPSTTYTYSIIYKTETGYSHPNYMYRYEYNGSGSYLTEAGVHNTSNRISLGDGWWFAWGQFTTQSTTATLNTYLFHYEYGTQNRIYVYKAALYAGTYVIPYQHMLNSAEVRGSTVATGGGWADIIGNSNNGTLTNGPTFDSSNGGSLVFDGTNDYVIAPRPSSLVTGGSISVSLWAKWITTGTTISTIQTLVDNNHSGSPVQGFVLQDRPDLSKCLTFSPSPSATGAQSTFQVGDGTWHHIVGTNDQSTTRLYIDGSLNAQVSQGGLSTVQPNISIGYWQFGGTRFLNGNIAQVSIYNKALTAAEVSQNFNALRGRFGI